MSFWRKKVVRQTVTCADVVNDFSSYLQDGRIWRDGNGHTIPSYDVEIIKSAIIAEAVRQGSSSYDISAKNGFLWLRSFIPGAKDLPDFVGLSDEQITHSLDVEMDALEAEFDTRLALARSSINA